MNRIIDIFKKKSQFYKENEMKWLGFNKYKDNKSYLLIQSN